jgi:hypothetical protein
MSSVRIKRGFFVCAFAALAFAAPACQASGVARTPGTDVRDATPPPTASSATASTIDSGATTQLATAPIDAGDSVSPPPLRWGTRPDKNAPFSYVIDGYCVQAKVDLLPNATMVHYGEHGTSYAALATDEGLSDWDRLSKGIDGYYLGDIRGTYPDNLWFAVDNGGRAFSSKHYMHFDRDHWAFGFGSTSSTDEKQLVALAPMPGGGALASMYRCPPDSYGPCTELGVVSDGAGKAPALGANGFSIQKILPFASGDVWAFGRACTGTAPNETCILQARRWKPGAKVAVEALEPGSQGYAEVGSTIAKDASDVIVSAFGKYLRFDGAKWTTFVWSGRTAGGELHAAPDGEIWSLKSGVLERRAADGTIAAIATPAPVAALEGVEVGAPWIIAGGAPARWDAKTGAFEAFTIPRSPFAWIESKKNFPTLEKIHVRSARDVWLNVKYTEFPAHYAEQNWDERRALLRTIPPNETLFCNPSSTHAFESAPPLATPECKTPLVILADVPATQKTDYPQSRKLVRGKKELEGTRYVEILVDQRKILGAAVPSFDVGKKLLTLMRANIPMVKPQMVCAAPSDARELTLD